MSLGGPGRVRWDRLAALLLLIFALYVIVEARKLSYTQGRVPGPGFAPFWIGVGMGVAALAILAETWRPRPGYRAEPVPQPELPPPQRVGWGTPLAMVAAMVAAVASAERLGILTALGLMLLVLVRILRGSWWAAVATALGLPLLFYLLFALWLKVPLPRGPWGF